MASNSSVQTWHHFKSRSSRILFFVRYFLASPFGSCPIALWNDQHGQTSYLNQVLSPSKESVLRKMEQPGLKLCGKCKVKKPVSQFYQAGLSKQGKPKYKPRCKPCYNENARDTYREKAPKRKAAADLAPSGEDAEHGPPQAWLLHGAMLYQRVPQHVDDATQSEHAGSTQQAAETGRSGSCVARLLVP